MLIRNIFQRITTQQINGSLFGKKAASHIGEGNTQGKLPNLCGTSSVIYIWPPNTRTYVIQCASLYFSFCVNDNN